LLHVTNGDVVVGMLAASGLTGDRLAWDDVLHEGPVRTALDDEAFRAERAAFLSASASFPYEEALGRLEARDRRLTRAVGKEDVVLWFEADLYDQLQILQILDRLEPERVELVCIGEHPSTDRFYGLGQLESVELPPLFERREPVTAERVDLARRGWSALGQPTPEALQGLLGDDLSALPFLADALRRLLEELPWTTDGLSRTERSLLAPLADGPADFADLFRAHMAAEERPFLGDLSAVEHLRTLSDGRRPLARASDGGQYTLTEDGRAALVGELDAVELRGIDRWLGGTHLGTPHPLWRWDPDLHRAVLR
jgi:Domain of unknown function (DUF1835)